MIKKSRVWQNQVFVFAFLSLTLFVWCPWGYGTYGPVPRFLGVPSWAVLALAIGAVLFLLEWVYLFHSQLAMNDEDLPDIIAQLKAVGADDPALAKEDE